MAAVRDQNLRMTAGSAVVFRVRLKTLSGGAPGLAGCRARWSAVEKLTGRRLVLKEQPDGVALISPDLLEITLKPEDTAGAPGRYEHEAQVWDALGNPSHVARGALIVEATYL